MQNKDLKRRIISISYKHKLSHIGSCLNAVDLIAEIYETKRPDDPFILSQGHAGLALYVVLEKHYGYDAEKLYLQHGVHPNRDIKHKIYASTGSLGHGIGIAVGMALANKKQDVYCIISDGEMAEGSVYEALNVAKAQELGNLSVYINCNGWGAYRRIYPTCIVDFTNRYQCLDISIRKTSHELPFWEGLDAHYMTLTDDQYKFAMNLYK